MLYRPLLQALARSNQLPAVRAARVTLPPCAHGAQQTAQVSVCRRVHPQLPPQRVGRVATTATAG
eukprot:850856-Pyramimonas_sp.AAC.1